MAERLKFVWDRTKAVLCTPQCAHHSVHTIVHSPVCTPQCAHNAVKKWIVVWEHFSKWEDIATFAAAGLPAGLDY